MKSQISRRNALAALGVAGSLTLAARAAAEPAPSGVSGHSTAAANKEIIRQYFDRCWNKGDLDFAETIMIPDYDLHLPDGSRGGHAAWKAGVTYFRTAFPDVHFDNLQLIAEDDLVAVRSVFRATHLGDFLGVPASGRPLVVRNADYYRLKDGKMTGHWDIPDFFSVMAQIGGFPEDFMKTISPVMLRQAWPDRA